MLSLKAKNTPEIVMNPTRVEGTFAGRVALGTGLQAVGAGVGAGVGVGVATKQIGVKQSPFSHNIVAVPAG